MKTIKPRAAVALIPIIASVLLVAPPANAAGVIPDAALAACINNELSRDPATPIQISDLESLKELVCEDEGVQDITGLEHLTNIEDLYLSENGFVDITPLSGLTKLVMLDLASNNILDVGPLAALTSLEFLALSSNNVEDPSPLQNLSALTYLSLDHNQITDLSSLDNRLPNLNRFYANNQYLFLPDATVGQPFSFRVTDVLGADVPVTLAYGDQGTYDLTAGTVTYTQGDFNLLRWSSQVTIGNVTATFSGSCDQNVLAAVTPAPLAPADDTATVETGSSTTIDVLGNDGDTTGWTVSATSTPTNGTVVVNADGTITYTPNKGYTGEDSFTYTVSKADGSTGTATVTVTVTEAPVTPPVDPVDPKDPQDPNAPKDPQDPNAPQDTTAPSGSPAGPADAQAPTAPAQPAAANSLATTGAESSILAVTIAGILAAAGILIGARRRRA